MGHQELVEVAEEMGREEEVGVTLPVINSLWRLAMVGGTCSYLPIVEQLVLQHLVVGHGPPEQEHLLQQKLSDLPHSFQLQFVHHVPHIKYSAALIEILLPHESDLVVQLVKVLQKLSLTGWSVSDVPGQQRKTYRHVFTLVEL